MAEGDKAAAILQAEGGLLVAFRAQYLGLSLPQSCVRRASARPWTATTQDPACS